MDIDIDLIINLASAFTILVGLGTVIIWKSRVDEKNRLLQEKNEKIRIHNSSMIPRCLQITHLQGPTKFTDVWHAEKSSNQVSNSSNILNDTWQMILSGIVERVPRNLHIVKTATKLPLTLIGCSRRKFTGRYMTNLLSIHKPLQVDPTIMEDAQTVAVAFSRAVEVYGPRPLLGKRRRVVASGNS